MTKKLYKFYWDCGRMGELEGLFVEDDEEIAKIIGKEIYFGEVLGKHSEIYGTLEEGDLKVIDIPVEALDAIVEATGVTISGYNPVGYYYDRLDELGEDNE